jgi:choline kinase
LPDKERGDKILKQKESVRMKAIILAAGRGERLMPLTQNTPKPLLDLGNGKTILETQLDAMEHCGIKEVVLVLGYLAEQIEAKIKKYKNFEITTVYNPFYGVSSNLASLWMAKHQMGDEFVIVNGDDIFHPRVFEGLLSVSEEKEICMVIDRKKNYLHEHMKVITKKNRVYAVSKEIDLQKANGESIGLIRFLKNGAKMMVETIEKMMRDGIGLKVFWLEALQQIMDEDFPVYYHTVREKDWAEIDFHPELEAVRASLNGFVKLTKKWQK